MWKAKYTFSDSSLFGEESEDQVFKDLFIKSLEDCEEVYRAKTIEIISNRIFEMLLDEGKEVLAEKFAKKFKDYIHKRESRINNRKELNRAWARFRKDLALRGQGAEYYKLRADFEDRKPRKEVMSLEIYVKIFEGEKGEE